MQFPLTFNDISLWLAVTAIILLITAELVSPHYGQANLTIDKRRLRTTALIIGLLFMFTVVIRIYGIITTS